MDSVETGLRLYSQPRQAERDPPPAKSSSRPKISPLERQQEVMRICQVPIKTLKEKLSVGKLNKGMLRLLAGRLTRTEQHIKYYGGMDREQLVRELAARGFQI